MAKHPPSGTPASHPAHPRPDLPAATWGAIEAVVGELVASSPGSRPGFVAVAKACRAARRAGRIPGCSNQQLDAALKYLADTGHLGSVRIVPAHNTREPAPAPPASDPLKIHINRFLDVVYDEQACRARVLVGGKPFLHCSFIVASIPEGGGNDIDSIDDLAAGMEHDARVLEGRDVREWLTPAEEVLAHASNLQAWAENGYDTRLLHSNIAFPLLIELTSAGDELAKRALSMEVRNRLSEGNTNTRIVILHYIIDCSRDAADSLVATVDDPAILLLLLEDKALMEEDCKMGREHYRRAFYITRALDRLAGDRNAEAITIREKLIAAINIDMPAITKAAILKLWGEMLEDKTVLKDTIIKIIGDWSPDPDDSILLDEILDFLRKSFIDGNIRESELYIDVIRRLIEYGTQWDEWISMEFELLSKKENVRYNELLERIHEPENQGLIAPSFGKKKK